MKGIIDRLEGEYAVVELENREMKNIQKGMLPEGVKEGSAIVFDGDRWALDEERTKKLKTEIDELAQNLFE